MKVLDGDLIALADAGHFDVIIHGCNCWHAMGAGIAAQIAKRWPEALEADKATKIGSVGKLGTYSRARVRCASGELDVINAYTQHRPGRDARKEYVQRAMIAIEAAQPGGVRIGYPMIGCGIGGLDWADVAPIMDAAFDGRDHTLVYKNGGTK